MTAKPWVNNQPEQRLSIALDRFLDRAMVRPCYFTAINDSDHGTRSDIQRMRDKNRGVKGGQLDWDLAQGPGLVRKLELKRGKNTLSPLQKQTVKVLTECGAAPIVAWSLREAYEGMSTVGFRFTANVETVLQQCEAALAGWDREADLIRSGEVVRKVSKPRKAEPRYTWG